MIVRGRDYEHTLAFPNDGGLRYEPVELGSLVPDVLAGRSFDAAEFTLAGLAILRDRGETGLVAIPVFPARSFFHSCLWVRRDSPLTELRDLAGRRIGLRDYTSTTSVWFRGHLKDAHGVDWRDLAWVVGPSRRFPPPPEADVRPAEGDLEDSLVAGEIDAFFSVRVRDGRKPVDERLLRPLLADPVAAEADYHRAAGFFPLLHVVVLSRALVEADPTAPRRVYDAYAAAKAAALKRRLGTTFLPWSEPRWDETLAAFGGDPLPYGLSAENRRNGAVLLSYLCDQRLIAAEPDFAALFHPESRDWPPA